MFERRKFTLYFGADFHLGHQNGHDRYPTDEEVQSVLSQAIHDKADAFFLLGDTINTAAEKYKLSLFAATAKRVPTYAITANHETKLGDPQVVEKAFEDNGIHILNDKVVTLKRGRRKLCIAGLHMDGATQTPVGKRLEELLKKSQARRNIVIMHPSPISGMTHYQYNHYDIAGLEKALDRYAGWYRRRRVIEVVYGHHHGPTVEPGDVNRKTHGGIPTYNVAAPLRKKWGKPIAFVQKI